MTLEDVFNRLHGIDQTAQALIREAGFSSDTGLAGKVSLPPDDPDARFLKESIELLLDPLEEMHGLLSYLEIPPSPEHILEKFPNGRYGYRDGKGSHREFTCGQSLEARVKDGSGRQRWVRTRVEHNGFDYFLAGYNAVPLDGLTVRERGQRI